MKKIFPIAFMCCLALTFFACQNNSDNGAQSDTTTPAATTPVTPNSPTPNPATTITTNSGVEHYICPNGHVGSGGDAPGSCSQCGAELSHNQAYHNQTQNTTPANTNSTSPVFQTQPQTTQPAAAKNAAGEWHYVCSANCGGGAGAQGNCPNCGSALNHNQAYHN